MVKRVNSVNIGDMSKQGHLVYMVNMADIISMNMNRRSLWSTRSTWCMVKRKANMINNTNIFKMVNIVNMVNRIYKFDMIVF